MRPARPAFTVLLAVVLTACGAAGTSPTTASVPSTAGACAEVVKEGAQITDTLIDQGCTDQNGTKRVGKVTTCENGQRLWEMDGMIGLSGKPMLAENAKGGDGLTARVLNETACRL